MFRITKVFENGSTSLYKIEGKVTDEILPAWIDEIERLSKLSDRDLILDFFGVWFISSKAVEFLLQSVSNGCYLLNCPMEVRNVFYSAGLSQQML